MHVYFKMREEEVILKKAMRITQKKESPYKQRQLNQAFVRGLIWALGIDAIGSRTGNKEFIKLKLIGMSCKDISYEESIGV